MKTICVAVICLSTVFLCVAGSRTEPQYSDLTKGFVIDPNRSFVYLKFDHIGKGIPFLEGEPATRIWLRIVNNCKVRIVVSTFGVPDGSPKSEEGVMHEVVADAPRNGIVTFSNDFPFKKRPTQEQAPSSKPEEEEMPRGYSMDVASSNSIRPGEEILFSIPVNHLGKRWHIEIPFDFDLPPGKGYRPDDIGGQPNMVIDYSLYDLPTKIQTKVEHWHDN